MPKQKSKANKEIVKFLEKLSEAKDGIEIKRDENQYVEGTIEFLQFFNAIDITSGKNSYIVKVASEPSHFFIKSLSVYIDENLNLISDWNHIGDKSSKNGSKTLTWGLQFLHLMEKRRVEQLRSTKVLNEVNIILLLIKGRFEDGIDRYLTEYSLTTHRYQLVGGYFKSTDKTVDGSIKRRLREDIPLTNIDFERDVIINKVGDTIKNTRVSAQKGVNTEYRIQLFHLIISKTKLTLSGRERWATLDELMQERTSHGKRIISPFGDTGDTNKLVELVSDLPSSFTRTQKLPEYQKKEKKDPKDRSLKITSLIGDDENENLEFKSSSRWDYNLGKVNKDLGRVIVKTVSGFMNSSGGYLLIGVNDKGEVLGIAKDLKTLNKKNEDGYQLFLMGQLSDILGKEFVSFVDVSFEALNGKVVCIVKVNRSTQPVFYKDGKEREFYVRTGNSTRALNIEETYRYIKFNWD